MCEIVPSSVVILSENYVLKCNRPTKHGQKFIVRATVAEEKSKLQPGQLARNVP